MGGVGVDVDAAPELDERLRHLLHALARLALADDALLGAGGIGVLLSASTASFDWPAVATVLAAIVLLSLAVDLLSERVRAALR